MRFPLTGQTCALAALLLAAGASLAGAQETRARERLLVVPFENTGRDGRLIWVSEGAAMLLTGTFESAGIGAVSREERLETFERLQLPRAASLSEATIIRAAQITGAAEVVMGSFTVADGQLTVHARLLRLDTGRMRPHVTETGPLADFFAIFARLSRKLLPSDAAPSAAAAVDHGSLAVFENYIKGLVAESTAGQIRFLEAALKLAPGFAPARIALWQVYSAQGDHARAVTAALPVPAGTREYRRARFLVAWSRIQLKQYDEAFQGLKALLDVSAAPAILNNLGVIQARRGSTPQTGRAAYYFTKAAEADPEDPDYAFNVGYAYWLDREPRAATYWLLEAVRRNPADGDAHFVLGAALNATGLAVEGEREKELARQLSSTYVEWEARPNAASELVPKGLERLRDDLESSRLTSPGTASTPADQKDQAELAAFHAERGRRLFEQQQDAEAIPELKRSLYLLPYQSDVHLLLGRIYVRTGRVAEAIEALKISLWSRETSEGHAVLGLACFQAKDEAGARAELQKAQRLGPDNADVKELAARLGVKQQ
jgi:tetratricopeptide (TPR) repeat protein